MPKQNKLTNDYQPQKVIKNRWGEVDLQNQPKPTEGKGVIDSNFYEKRLQETVTDGQVYVPELLLAILKELEKLNCNKLVKKSNNL